MITNFKLVPLDHYTCTNCGYTEEWVTDKNSLEFLRRKYKEKGPREGYSDFV
jgi:predicted nucleic-acid-binding Zn-ribbon protein